MFICTIRLENLSLGYVSVDSINLTIWQSVSVTLANGSIPFPLMHTNHIFYGDILLYRLCDLLEFRR